MIVKIDDKAIRLRQKYKIKTPDAIIGATAKQYGLAIVTNNVNDFKHFDLEIVTL